MNLIVELDRVIGPVAIAANRLRQVRDALPASFWLIVPSQVRAPVELLFDAIEAYDRKLGVLTQLGLLQEPGNSQTAPKQAEGQNNG